MTPQHNSLTSLRYILVLIAVVFAAALTLLIYFVTSAATTLGSTPDFAISLNRGMNTGILTPGEQRWFRLTPNPHLDQYQAMSLNMFFTVDREDSQRHVNFELFSAAEINSWQRGDKDAPVNFGAGMPVSHDGDAWTGERIWQGTVLRDQLYYLALKNNSDAPVDYWLTDGDKPVLEPDMSSQAAGSPESGPVFSKGSTPQVAIPLVDDRYTNQLAPGKEFWYSFAIDKSSDTFEPVALTLIFTPDDGNRIRDITMDIFTAAGVMNWSPESSAGLNNVGAGSMVVRDNNPLTGERFWSGWVVNNDLYYVRLRNGSEVPVDFWLFNGDVYQPELGTTAP